MELHLPLDFERLPEFRRLVGLLRAAERGESRTAASLSAATAHLGRLLPEAVGTFLVTRLFVELGLLAKSKACPGQMSLAEAPLFEATVNELFGEDCPPVQLLEQSGFLTVRDGGYHCEWFSRLNAHLSADYKPGHERGNIRSAIVRGQKQVEVDALAQGSLLPVELYRTRTGAPMADADKRRCLVLIGNLDRCLGQRTRRLGDFTEGLLADAYEVISQHDAESLKAFYFWLGENRDKPVLPKVTEKILSEWSVIYAAAKLTKLTPSPSNQS